MRLSAVTPENVSAACRLAVRPDQERFVAPVAWSLADAYTQPDVAWPRLVYDGDRLVAFVMGAFDPGNSTWFLAEARRRGQQRASVLWVPGPGGPEGFYLRLGFRPTGETLQDQVVGQISLG